MLKVFIVTQNVVNLYGFILHKAIVLAETASTAEAVLLAHCGRLDDVVVVKKNRLRVCSIGTADEDMDECVVCVETTEDWSELETATDVIKTAKTARSADVADADSDIYDELASMHAEFDADDSE